MAGESDKGVEFASSLRSKKNELDAPLEYWSEACLLNYSQAAVQRTGVGIRDLPNNKEKTEEKKGSTKRGGRRRKQENDLEKRAKRKVMTHLRAIFMAGRE